MSGACVHPRLAKNLALARRFPHKASHEPLHEKPRERHQLDRAHCDCRPGDPDTRRHRARLLRQHLEAAARDLPPGDSQLAVSQLMAAAVPKVLPKGGARLIESFLDMMGAERGASANTLAAYRRDLLDFGAALARGPRDFRSAEKADLKRHIATLSGMAASTQARRLSALRQFFGFLYSEGIRRDDPTNSLEAPRRSRPLPKILSAEDVTRLLETAASTGTPEALDR